jgi:hypothetical protein
VTNANDSQPIDHRILKTIGVRFVITHLPISGATLCAQIPIPVCIRPASYADSHTAATLIDSYLYELDGVNLGQLSHTASNLASDVYQPLGYLADGKTPSTAKSRLARGCRRR